MMTPKPFNLLFLLAISAAAQQAPPEPTFRAGTRLVEVSVVAQSTDGKPVAELRREDFQIFDDGKPQEIRVFLADAPAAPEARTQNTFTNRVATEGQGGYSVLLFDNLNVDPGVDVFGHTSRARQKALKALMAIPPGDRIAIYALWCQFQVFREFTSDRDSLLRQLEKFAPAPGSCVEGGNGPQHALTERNFIPLGAPLPVSVPVSPPTAGHADDGAPVSASITADIADEEIKQLAEHLAGIPGRKNLIWLTTMFRLKPSNLQELINANVAIYPVDTIGSMIGLPSEKEARYAPLRALAAVTGGVAYYDRDDLDSAIHDALNDGHISYTIGFYQPDEDDKTPVHRIGVRVDRQGVTLRYRATYKVEPPAPVSSNPVHEFVQAMNRPVEATAIGMSASATRAQDRLDLSVNVDISGLDLELTEGLWKGKAELVLRFVTADGVQAGDTLAETMILNLRPATYTSMLENGAQYHKEIPIPPNAVELKLLAGSLASGKIGTLRIPLSDVKSGSAR